MLSVPFKSLEKIARRIYSGSLLTRADELQGGMSARVILLEIRKPDSTDQPYLLRVHSEIDRTRSPEVAAHEFLLLTRLRAAGLPVPEPILLDDSGEILPEPYVVLTYIRGKTEFSPPDLPGYLRACAGMLARVHAVKHQAFDLDFLPDRGEHALWWIRYQPDRLDEALLEGLLRRKLRSVFPVEQVNEPSLLHGDFWPGNLIWEDGELAGVIDWEDAEVGDPLSDLSVARLEILWAFGRDAMHELTRVYQSLRPDLDYGNLPYWDLFSALRPAGQLEAWATSWGPNGRPDVTYDALRMSQNWFVEQALQRIRE